MSETRKYRKFSAQQKPEIVLASLRGQTSMADLCREHDIADSLFRTWREQFLAAGALRLAGKAERTELRAQVTGLERALGRKTMEVEIAGELLRAGSEHARRPVPRARRARPPGRGRRPRGRDLPPGALPPSQADAASLDAIDRHVLDVARESPTDGTRMVAALAARQASAPVNRKRVQCLMREHRLLQPKRSEGRRRPPGFFQVTRPDELWRTDMTSVWVAEHGWCYLNASSLDYNTPREVATAWQHPENRSNISA